MKKNENVYAASVTCTFLLGKASIQNFIDQIGPKEKVEVFIYFHAQNIRSTFLLIHAYWMKNYFCASSSWYKWPLVIFSKTGIIPIKYALKMFFFHQNGKMWKSIFSPPNIQIEKYVLQTALKMQFFRWNNIFHFHTEK